MCLTLPSPPYLRVYIPSLDRMAKRRPSFKFCDWPR